MWNLILLLPAFLACGTDEDTDLDEQSWRPDLVCPGDANCASADGELQAGASAVSITPSCYESWEDLDGNAEYSKSTESFFDCGCDRLCEGDEGYPGADEGEGDGEFQAIWMAGFQTGRPAMGSHDDLWARAVALQQGDTTVVVVSVDLVGFFYDDVVKVRELVAEAGTDVDLILVSATHQHEGPDTVGIWGERDGVRGTNEAYMEEVRDNTATAVIEAVASLQAATLTMGAIDTAEPFERGTANTIRDSRDPVIIDQMLYTAHLAASDGSTIATMVNWGNHPEVLSDENNLITSDYAHYIREGVENGVVYEGYESDSGWVDGYEVEGLGGICVYVQGTVGGLMTPLGITVTNGAGESFTDADFAKAEALGFVIAELALQSVVEGEVDPAPALAARSAQLYLAIDNWAFQAMFLIETLARNLYNWDETEDLDETNTPDVLTEIDLIDLGGIRMLSVPGELFPEWAIGGYDGSRVGTDEYTLIDPNNENPPDLSQAPEGPYLKDKMGSSYNWIIGLGNDELGYIVPPYDYKIDEALPYFNEAPGDHYEETMSLGINIGPEIEAMATDLIEWTP